MNTLRLGIMILLTPILLLFLAFLTIPIHEAVHLVHVNQASDLEYKSMCLYDCEDMAGYVEVEGSVSSSRMERFEEEANTVQLFSVVVLYLIIFYFVVRDKKRNGGDLNADNFQRTGKQPTSRRGTRRRRSSSMDRRR